MRRYQTFLLFTFLFTSVITQAQDLVQSIKGTVTDQQSGAPVIGAVVVVLDLTLPKSTGTNVDGNFRIDGVPIGRHNIQITAFGYEPRVYNQILISSGKETVINVSMMESFVENEELVLDIKTSTNKQGDVKNEMATVSATSVTMEQTKRTAGSFEDPGRAVLSMPGVTSNSDDNNEIVIRGNSPRGVLWRMEGIEIPNPNHFAEEGATGGYISALSTNVMDNSDFYTSAFPAEFGNATSGVFDISLRKGNNDKREFGFQMGILGVQATAEGPFKDSSRSSYLLNYRYSTLALFDDIGVDILGDQEDLSFQDLSMKLFFPTDKAGDFSVWMIGGKNSLTYNGEGLVLDGTDTLYNDFSNEIWKTGMMASGITHKIFLNDETYLKSTLAFTGTTNYWDADSVSIKSFSQEDITNTSYRGSFLLNHKFNKKHTLRTGVILSQLNFNHFAQYRLWESGTGFGEFNAELDEKGGSQLFQGYSQWQWRVNQNLTLNTGLHAMNFALNGNTSIEPRLGMNWNFAKDQTLSAGVGIHSRMETIAVYNARYKNIDGSYVTPNADLGFTKASHFVVGYTKRIKGNMRFKSEVYYQRLSNVPVRPENASEGWAASFSALNSNEGWSTDTLVNEGTGTNMGVELTMERFFSDGFYYLATASIFDSKYTNASGEERNTRYNANWVFNVMGGKEWKVGKSDNNLLSVNGRLISSGGKRVIPIDLDASIAEGYTVRDYDNAYERKLSNYFRLDLGVQYRKNKPKHSSIWSLSVQNITNRLNAGYEYFSSTRNRIETSTQLGLLPVFSYRIEF